MDCRRTSGCEKGPSIVPRTSPWHNAVPAVRSGLQLDLRKVRYQSNAVAAVRQWLYCDAIGFKLIVATQPAGPPASVISP